MNLKKLKFKLLWYKNLMSLNFYDFKYAINNHFDFVKEQIDMDKFVWTNKFGTESFVLVYHLKVVFDYVIKNDIKIDFKKYNELFELYKNNDLNSFIKSEYDKSFLVIFCEDKNMLIEFANKFNMEDKIKVLKSLKNGDKKYIKRFIEKTKINIDYSFFITHSYYFDDIDFVKYFNNFSEYFKSENILMIFEDVVYFQEYNKMIFLLNNLKCVKVLIQNTNKINLQIQEYIKVSLVESFFNINDVSEIIEKSSGFFGLYIYAIKNNNKKLFEYGLNKMKKQLHKKDIEIIYEMIVAYERYELLYCVIKCFINDSAKKILIEKINDNSVFYKLISEFNVFDDNDLLLLLKKDKFVLSNHVLNKVVEKINENKEEKEIEIEENIIKKYKILINLIDHKFLSISAVKYIFENKIDYKYNNIQQLLNKDKIMSCKNIIDICEKYNINIEEEEIIKNVDLLIKNQNKKSLIQILNKFDLKNIIHSNPYCFYGSKFRYLLSENLKTIPPDKISFLIIKAGDNNDCGFLKKIMRTHGKCLPLNIFYDIFKSNIVSEDFFKILASNFIKNHGDFVFLYCLDRYSNKDKFENSKHGRWMINNVSDKSFNNYVLGQIFNQHTVNNVFFIEYLIDEFYYKINDETINYLKMSPEYNKKFSNLILNKKLKNDVYDVKKEKKLIKI